MKIPSIKYIFLRKIKLLLGFGNVVSADTWNAEYESGKWDAIEQLDEYPRYLSIIGYVTAIFDKAIILDVGCGTGHLSNLYTLLGHDYTGIDLSKSAIEKAKTKFPNQKFFNANMDEYHTSIKYDAIVFNESLYHAYNPSETINNYSKFLRDGGIMIVSMSNNKHHSLVFNKIKKELTKISGVEIKFGNQKISSIYVFKRNNL